MNRTTRFLLAILCVVFPFPGPASLAAEDPRVSIHDVVRRGDLQACVEYLRHSQNVDEVVSAGNTLLHVAVVENQLPIAIYLLMNGSNVSKKNSEGSSPVELALASNNEDMGRLLRASGSSLSGVEATLERRLHLSILRDDLVQVGVRLLKGEGINSKDPERGWSPLHVAALHNKPSFVELFIALGANPDATDDIGQRPIHFVAELGNLAIANRLLDSGADVNAVVTTSGATALQMAVLSGNHDMIRLLLDRGADVNAEDKRGWAPIHIVALKGYPEICQTLLESGADPGIITNQNYTASLIAMASENRRVLELLRSHSNQ